MTKNDLLQYINDSDFGQKLGEIQYKMTHRPRSKKELQEYLDEAWDKVWLMRSSPVEANEYRTEEQAAEIEERRVAAIDRILSTYDDIPEKGYSDWECGFWNGVLGTLRWCLGEEEKDWLDT